jgi:hypothetical protein
MDIDHDKLDAALAELRAEKERRAAQIEAGEVVRVQMILGGDEDNGYERLENWKKAKTAELRAAGEKRKIHFDTLLVITGVPRDPDFNHDSHTSGSSADVPQYENRHAGRFPPQQPAADTFTASPQPATYIRIEVRPASDDGDPGAIAEGFYSVEDGAVVLRDCEDRHLASRVLTENADPSEIARQLLRETAGGEDFNRPLRYPPLSVA